MVLAVEKIYKKILEVYPFLTKKEENAFTKKAQIILGKSLKEKYENEETIKDLLVLLGKNGHVDIKKWHKPDRDFIRRIKIRRIPSFYDFDFKKML